MPEYAMVNRPLMIGTAPKGWIKVMDRPTEDRPFHHSARHGVLVYDHSLTPEETRQYELAPMIRKGSWDEQFQHAVAVDTLLPRARDIQRAKETLNEKWMGALEAAVFGAIERHWGGYPMVFEDPRAFVQGVYGHLTAVWTLAKAA